jgi:hypothetical protein
LVRVAVALTLLALLGWVGLFSFINSSNAVVTSRLDPWVWLLHLASLLVFVGAAVIAVWYCRIVWAGGRRWPARVWSVVLAVSSVTVLWVALVFKLIAFNAHF